MYIAVIGIEVVYCYKTSTKPQRQRQRHPAIGEHRDILGKPAPLHGRSKGTVSDGIERYAKACAARPGGVAVLIVLDGDDDCVAELGNDLVSRVSADVQQPVVIALADRDFEDWIYASIETLELTDQDMKYRDDACGLTVINDLLKPKAYAKPVWQPRQIESISTWHAHRSTVSLVFSTDSTISLLQSSPSRKRLRQSLVEIIHITRG